MRTIEKKIWPQYFKDILSGRKKVELRLADFTVEPGDTLFLKEWNPDTKSYTGRETSVKVTYVLKTKGQTFWPEEEVAKHGFQIIQFISPKQDVS